MRILGLIPARGGSKGVPKKNIKMLCGKPLIQYTIEAAIKSEAFADIFVSTEDLEIADISTQLGIRVPILRPSELAQDTTPTLPVIQHVLEYYKSLGISFDAVFLLQPTCPFRTAEQINDSIIAFQNQKVDSLISVLEVPQKYNPYLTYFQNEDKLLHPVVTYQSVRRQDIPVAYIREGSIYLFHVSTIENYGNIYGEAIGYYKISGQSVNIDSMEDFYQAERMIMDITLRG